MDVNDQKEHLSLAYIRAVAAQTGYQVSRPELDKDSVDGILMADSGSRPQIHFQAKATSRDVLQDDALHFPLSMKNYNDLRADVRNPRILIVFLMPKEDVQWLEQSEIELCLRHCAYWLSLEGRSPVPNTATVTVHVPTTNIFNCAQLRDLMTKANDGRPLC